MDAQQTLCKKQTENSSTPRKVLFVCTGNTCRSPMAAALLNEMSRPREICSAAGELCTAPRLVASSAGLYAREGDPITPAAADALREAGIPPRPDNDYSAHRARLINSELVAQAGEVVGRTASHAMQLMLRFPEAASKIRTLPMDISDPFGGNAEVYRACLAQLRYALELAYFTGADHDA